MDGLESKELCGMAVKLGADYSEAWIESLLQKSAGFSGKRPEPSLKHFSKGFSLRIFKNGGQALVSGDDFDLGSVKRLVAKGLKLASSSANYSENWKAAENAPSAKAMVSVKGCASIPDVTFKEMNKVLLRVKASLPAKFFPKLYLGLSTSLVSTEFANSAGCSIKTRLPSVDFFYSVVARRNHNFLQREWSLGNTGGFDLVEKMHYVDRIVSDAFETRDCVGFWKKPPLQKIDLVLGPQLAGILAHESCGHPFEADRILGFESAQGGKSYADFSMKGMQIANSAVNISDNTLSSQSNGYYVFDDEGVKKTKVCLIKNGVVNGFLHDRFTAQKLGKKSTGNSRRGGLARLPIVRMSNTFFEKGSFKEEELFEGIKKGIYIKTFSEWNIDERRENQKYVGCISYFVKNGRLTKMPVRLPALESTTKIIMQAIDAAADNFEIHAAICGKGEPMQGIAVGIGGPSIRLRQVRFK